MGFLYPEEILKVFKEVDLKKKEGVRDFTILNLLYDSGARATEIATLNFDYFDPRNKTIAFLGKGEPIPVDESLPGNSLFNHKLYFKLPY